MKHMCICPHPWQHTVPNQEVSQEIYRHEDANDSNSQNDWTNGSLKTGVWRENMIHISMNIRISIASWTCSLDPFGGLLHYRPKPRQIWVPPAGRTSSARGFPVLESVTTSNSTVVPTGGIWPKAPWNRLVMVQHGGPEKMGGAIIPKMCVITTCHRCGSWLKPPACSQLGKVTPGIFHKCLVGGLGTWFGICASQHV